MGAIKNQKSNFMVKGYEEENLKGVVCVPNAALFFL
jgi:hypothetical protein